MEQPQRMGDYRLLKQGAMIRYLHEELLKIVYIPMTRVPNTISHEFVLMNTEGILSGYTFSDKDWEDIDVDPVNKKIITPQEYRLLEFFQKFRQTSYWDCIGQGAFEWVVEEQFAGSLLSIKIVTGKQLAHERIYAPVDIMVHIKSHLKRTWVPRTERGLAWVHNMLAQHGENFFGRVWDTYRDCMEYDRIKYMESGAAREWFLQFTVDRMKQGYAQVKLNSFDPAKLEHLRKPLSNRKRSRPGSVSGAENYRFTESLGGPSEFQQDNDDPEPGNGDTTNSR